GKCSIRLVKDIRTLGECDVRSPKDTFFSLVSYDPNNSRLASVQGEIRVGGSYQSLIIFGEQMKLQAKVPPLEIGSAVDEPDRDELVWRPGYISEESEHVYKRATRSFRMFAMVRNEHVTQMERDFRTGDLCMYDAIITLHKCGYNVNHAIEAMNKNDEHLLKVTNFMSADDAKKFAKGIKTYGKNFLKIKKELLPHHERDELVQFYYGWKKTRDATRPKPLTRQRNTTAATYRKPKNNQSKATRAGSTDLADYASASETEVDELESDGRACHHCYSSKSKDWHHSGKERQLLCTECRIFYKKYGQLRPVDRPSTVPPSLHKPKSADENDEEDHGVRTRAGNKKERRRTPSDTDKKSSSPQSLSDLAEIKQRNGKRKRNHIQTPEHMNGNAKRRIIKEEKDDSGAESMTLREEDMSSSRENSIMSDSLDNKKASIIVESEVVEKMETEAIQATMAEGMAASPESSATAALRQPLSVASSSNMRQLAEPLSSGAVTKNEEELLVNGTISNDTKPSTSTANLLTDSIQILGIDVKMLQDRKVDEKEMDDGSWKIGDSVVETTNNASFVRIIERRCGQMSARTDLAYRIKPGCEWIKKREARTNSAKHQANVGNKKPAETTVLPVNPIVSSAPLPQLPNTPGVEAFMGGRVPMNGLPAMFQSVPDPRLAFLSPQQQYAAAFAIEQRIDVLQHAALHKQMEQQIRAHQMELMRNGGNGAVTPTATASRDTPSRGAAAHALSAANMMPSAYHGFGMDPRAFATLMHNPQMAAQFGIGLDGHTAAMMNALEQRSAIEQRMLVAQMGGLDMLAAAAAAGPNGNLAVVSQSNAQPNTNAPPPPTAHLHPHAAAMMQHAAAAAAASQPNSEAIQLQQLLALSAAAQAQRPFMEQNPLLQMSMMNSFGSEMASRMVNPGALSSDMMRRLQQEGGFTPPQQRP
ncbi:unnamed protein product, partial [Anisakis simplex]|uniref:Egg-laying defective protein 27 (inferred by orthology to a C. elegans protein) n=1 Tax=Anisakis simplex TaxID=6269 RepID=A0A0M3JR76_ANISI